LSRSAHADHGAPAATLPDMTYPPAQPVQVQIASGAGKSSGVAYLLWFFLGIFGGHRFYLRQNGTAILWLFTGGLFLVGWIVDLFLIPSITHRVNTFGR
jgi:hypothetical protein